MDFDACIARLTGKAAKDAYALTQQIVEESRASDAWYPCFDRFAELLRHKNSLVRNRAIAILAANARWDREGKFDAENRGVSLCASSPASTACCGPSTA